MSTGDYLNLHPSELKFPFELKKQISCSLQLTNITDQNIAFKVKTTNTKKYCVRPNTGIVLPGSVCNVTVTMQAQKEAPPGMQCKDKFLVQSIVAPNGAAAKDITVDMFNKKEKEVVKEFKLEVLYVPVNPPLHVHEESEEGYSTMVEPGSQSSSRPNGFGLQFGEFGSMSTGDFLNIHPSELKFPFEVDKESSCSLQLTNKTDQYIAFKVKTTKPKNYYVRPNTGIVLPRSVCNVTIRTQAQKEAPLDMQCKHKFLLQSVAVPNGKTVQDITADMFSKEDGKVVKEFRLRVVHISADSPSPVSEEFEESYSTMVEYGSQSSSRPHVETRYEEPKELLSKEVNTHERTNKPYKIPLITELWEGWD